MVVFQAAEGCEDQFGKNIILLDDKKALKNFLRTKYNKRYVIDEDEVDDDNGLPHSQAIFVIDYKGMAGIVGYCDCKTFEKVSYKPDDEKKTKDAQKVSDSEQQKTSDTNVPDELVDKYLRKQNEELMNWIKTLNKENKELKKELADRQLADRVTKLEQIVSKQAKNKKSNWTY